jgi:hypothetical protein
MWTAELVKMRFIEAADIERRMLVKGMSSGGNAWPTYSYDAEDMAGWDDQAIQDNLERWQGRKVTKSPELTRWEEVFFEWTMMVREDRRVLIWRWAQCIASGRSFSEWCQRKGINRVTAYKRIERLVEALVSQFRFEARLLRSPDGKWSLQQEPDEAPIASTMETAANNAGPVEHPPYRTEKSCDTLTTPASVAAFSQHLAEVNEQRRKVRLRKALRGVPGESARMDTQPHETRGALACRDQAAST